MDSTTEPTPIAEDDHLETTLVDEEEEFPFWYIRIRKQEDDQTRLQKQKWNRCLEAAIKVLKSESGLDVGVSNAGSLTRSTDKTSFEKAAVAYEELRAHLIELVPLTEKEKDEYTQEIAHLDKSMEDLTKLKASTENRIRNEDARLRMAMDKTRIKNAPRSRGSRSRKGHRSRGSRSSVTSYDASTQGERIENALKSQIRLLNAMEEERERTKMLELEERHKKLQEELEQRQENLFKLRKEEEISRQQKEAEEEARELKRKKEEEAQRKKWDAEASEREEKLKEEERNLERIRKRVEDARIQEMEQIKTQTKLRQAQIEHNISVKMATDLDGAMDDLVEKEHSPQVRLSSSGLRDWLTPRVEPSPGQTKNQGVLASSPCGESTNQKGGLLKSFERKENPQLPDSRFNTREGEHDWDIEPYATHKIPESPPKPQNKDAKWHMKPYNKVLGGGNSHMLDSNLAFASGYAQGRQADVVDKFGTFDGDERDFPRFKVVIQKFMEEFADHPRGAEMVYREVCRRCVGRAAKAISFSRDIVNSTEALEQAMSRLEKFFGDARAVVLKHQRELTRKETIGGDMESLQDLLMEMERSQVVLKQQGSAQLLDNQNTVDGIVTHRFPEDMRDRFLNWCVYTGIEFASYRQLLLFVEREMARCALPYARSNHEQKGKRGRRDTRAHIQTGGAPTHVQNGQEEKKERKENWTPLDQRPCICCGEINKHKPYNCEKFKSLDVPQRWKKVKENKLCHRCTGWAHVWRKCRGLSDKGRDCRKCGSQSHHTLLCDTGSSSTVNRNDPPLVETQGATDQGTPKQYNASTDQDLHQVCYLPIIKVKAISPSSGRTIELNALIDSGATDTISTYEVAERLGLSGIPQTTTLHGATGLIQTNFFMIDFLVQNRKGGATYPLRSVRCFPNMNWQHGNPLGRGVQWKKYKHLEGVELDSVESNKIDLIIGQDHGWLLDEQEVRRGPEGPTAKRSLLGWYLVGRTCLDGKGGIGTPSASLFLNCGGQRSVGFHLSPSTDSVLCNGIPETCPLLHKELSRILDYGQECTGDEDTDLSVEDKEAIKIIDESIRITDDGHWEMELPLRKNVTWLPDNRAQAVKRLQQLRQLPERHPDTWDFYKESMIKLKADHLEEAPVVSMSYLKWHIYHFCTKQTKPRIVYDAKAQFGGYSLNSCLLPGPNTMNSLTDILMRFRLGQVAFACDIKEQFLQIRINEKNRDLLTILWFEDDDPNGNVSDYRFEDLPYGVISAPYMAGRALKETADENAAEVDMEVVEVLKENFYVDDGLDSEDSEEEAIKVAKGLIKILQRRGFNLRKFVSNSRALLTALPEDKISSELKELDLDYDDLPEHKVLGVRWEPASDQLVVKVNLQPKEVTKRGVFSILGQIFDPLGICQPYLLTGRHILQDICQEVDGWDEIPPEHLAKRWKRWVAELETLEKLKMNRCYTQGGKAVGYSLHTFSDASEKGKGCVSYLVAKYETHKEVAFINGKARTVHKGCTTSIPRLELIAAEMGAEQHCRIKRALRLKWDKCYLWTDSTAVKLWLENHHGRFKKFVTRRLESIRRNSAGDVWRYVDTKNNPADVASRGAPPREASTENMYQKGPEYLLQPETEWPQLNTSDSNQKRVSALLEWTNDDETDDEIDCCARHWEQERERG